MESSVTGRHDKLLPATWLRLIAPGHENADLAALVRAAIAAETVIDISSNAALWGGYLRATCATLMTVGPLDLATSVDEQQVHDLVLAHLIETLSAIGREYIDFYFLWVDRPLKEFQISGALIALQEAKEEGNIRIVGIAAHDILASQTILHFHQGFESLLLPKEETSGALRALARGRNMAIVTRSQNPSRAPQDEAVLIPVSSANDVEAAVAEGLASCR